MFVQRGKNVETGGDFFFFEYEKICSKAKAVSEFSERKTWTESKLDCQLTLTKTKQDASTRKKRKNKENFKSDLCM